MKSLIKDGKIVLDVTKILDNKKIDFKGMDQSEILKYVLSHYGLKTKLCLPKKARISPRGNKTELDSIIDKRSDGAFLNDFKGLTRLKNHAPVSSVNYVGVEIECFIPYESLDVSPDNTGHFRECSDCEGSGNLTFTHRNSGHETESECPSCSGSGEVECEDSDDNAAFEEMKSELARKIAKAGITRVNIVEDGSLKHSDSERYCPMELKILLRSDDMTPLKKLCDLLTELKAVVNNSCGLHVHLDMRKKCKSEVIEIGEKFEPCLPILASMIPARRRVNNFCKLRVSDIDRYRYSAVNLTAFSKYRTIEIRLHSGTVVFEKINNWIMILSKISQSSGIDVTDVDSFCSSLDITGELKEYIESRIAKFNVNQPMSQAA